MSALVELLRVRGVHAEPDGLHGLLIRDEPGLCWFDPATRALRYYARPGAEEPTSELGCGLEDPTAEELADWIAGKVARSPMPEPAGLWAVVESLSEGWPVQLVKAPGETINGRVFGPYWYQLGTESAWSWDQVTRWPGELRVIRAGVQ